jgi:ribosomal protein L29
MVKQKLSTKLSKEMSKEVKGKTQQISKGELLANYRSALMILKMKNKMGQLIETHRIKALKKEIARLLTKNKKNK